MICVKYHGRESLRFEQMRLLPAQAALSEALPLGKFHDTTWSRTGRKKNAAVLRVSPFGASCSCSSGAPGFKRAFDNAGRDVRLRRKLLFRRAASTSRT